MNKPLNLGELKPVPIIRLNQPSHHEIVNLLIDTHNNMRCGKTDNARLLIERILSDMTLNWSDEVQFPRQPTLADQ